MTHLSVINPYSLEEIQTLPKNSRKDIETALKKATEAEKLGPLPKPERIQILKELLKLLTSLKPTLIKTACLEGGKPHKDTVVEIERGLLGIQVAIQSLSSMAGKEIPMEINASSSSRVAFTRFQPLGLVVALSAFNHPFNLIIHQVIPAIAAGCPFIIKPSSQTPLSCKIIMEQLYLSGLPSEWGQMLILDHEDATLLATDSRVKALSFIGSGKVGWKLKSQLTPGARCTLEHGGVAPVILAPDAKVEEILPGLVRGCFYHAGQVCVSVQKIYVHENMLQNFQAGLITEAEKLVVGDPLDPKTDIGPIIKISELERIHSWVLEAKEKGATILLGGEKSKGQSYPPTILLNPPEDCQLMKEEVFGPVVVIESYQHIHDVVQKINDMPFAFQAGVYGQDLDWLMTTAQKIYAQTVMINDHSAFRVDWMPFGGLKQSGIGLGGIENSIREYSIEKLYVMKLKELE